MKKPTNRATETRAQREKRPIWFPRNILEDFSVEQRQMIRRLSSVIGSKDEETVYELAAAALYVFQLDPFARDSFDRVSKAAGTNAVDEGVINSCINEMCEAAEVWTLKQRAAERAAQLKGRAA